MRLHIFNHTVSHSEARRLTALFMDGDTTLAQERLLYRYFSQTDVADDLQEYREMFMLLAQVANEEPSAKDASGGSGSIFRWLAVAASVALILTIGVALLQPDSECAYDPACFAQVYGGSYVVRNGQRITDPAEIEREVRRAEEYMEAQDRMLENYLNSLEDIEQSVIDETFLSPKTREIILQTLNQ